MTQLFSPNVGLPYIDTFAQKHVIANAAFEKLDALVMLAAADRTLTNAPSSPVDGVRHLVPPGGWTSHPGHANQVAHYAVNAWTFYAPKAGWLCFVTGEARLLAFNGTSWIDAASGLAELQNLTRLGVGTTADATNVFAAKLANVLWTAKPVAEGGSGDLRAKLSKEAAANTLSLLFQTNYSGRAEFGLTGDDDFRMKVSANGSTWSEAFWIARATGRLTVSNSLRLNGVGAGSLVTDANGVVTVSSDARLKTVTGPFERTIRDLAEHDAGRPVRFRWREDSGLDASGEYIGFLAQDYARGVPEAVGVDSRGYRTFSDRTALAVLHNTAFDHEERIDVLTRTVATLSARVDELEAGRSD